MEQHYTAYSAPQAALQVFTCAVTHLFEQAQDFKCSVYQRSEERLARDSSAETSSVTTSFHFSESPILKVADVEEAVMM